MKKTIDFLLLYDLEVRDKRLIKDISKALEINNFSTKVAKLNEEFEICKKFKVKNVLINKPHFHYLERIINKLKGVKFIVLDTEGILPANNSQRCILEPDGYIHWFTHQKERYSFEKCNQIVTGYPRKNFISPNTSKTERLISVATNFSALFYSRKEILKKRKDRKLKLKNDFDLIEYRNFQRSCLKILLKIIKSNPSYNFILKPHPNDAKKLWAKIESKKFGNLVIMNPQLEISSLFKENPEFHMCLDGCTTILDAYYANLDTITLGRFNEFNGSKLRFLEKLNISSSEYKIEKITSELSSNSFPFTKDQIFFEELNVFDKSKIIKLLTEVNQEKSFFKMSNLPDLSLLSHFLKDILKRIIPIRFFKLSRKKII